MNLDRRRQSPCVVEHRHQNCSKLHLGQRHAQPSVRRTLPSRAATSDSRSGRDPWLGRLQHHLLACQFASLITEALKTNASVMNQRKLTGARNIFLPFGIVLYETFSSASEPATHVAPRIDLQILHAIGLDHRRLTYYSFQEKEFHHEEQHEDRTGSSSLSVIPTFSSLRGFIFLRSILWETRGKIPFSAPCCAGFRAVVWGQVGNFSLSALASAGVNCALGSRNFQRFFLEPSHQKTGIGKRTFGVGHSVLRFDLVQSGRYE